MEKKIYNQIIDFVEGKANPEESQYLLDLIEKDDMVAQLYCDIVEMQQVEQQIQWDGDQAFIQWKERLNPSSGGGRIISMKRRNHTWLKIAAVLVPLIIIASIIFNQAGDTDSAMIEVFTQLDEKKEVTLPDGSLITLNERSKLTYESNFKVREVHFSGEAFFDIASDPNKPFSVKNDHAKVTVLGTQFNVSTLQEDGSIEVAVVEGKVRVEELADPANFVELTPDEMAVYEAEESKITKIETNAKNKIAWNTLILDYKNIPLDQVIADLEKVYKVDFELANDQIGNCTYVVNFDEFTIEQVITALEWALGGEIEKANNQYIINAKPCN